MMSWVLLLIVVSVVVLLALAGYYDFQRLSKSAPTSLMQVEMRERINEVRGDPRFIEAFRELVTRFRQIFHPWHVWGQYIHAGTGYGIYVTDGVKKSCIQVKSLIKVDGQDQDNDLRSLSSTELDDMIKNTTILIRKTFGENSTHV